MKSNRHEGLLGTIISFLVLLLVLGFGVAFLRSKHIHNPSEFMTYIGQTSNHVGDCAHSVIDKKTGKCKINFDSSNSQNNEQLKKQTQANSNFNKKNSLTNRDLDYSGPQAGSPYIPDSIKYTKQAYQQELQGMTTSQPKKVAFYENKWPHFISEDNPCWSTKNQVMYEDKVNDNKFVMLNSYRNVTSNLKNACSIKTGVWIDSYTGQTINLSSSTLDYVIPLSYANSMGGNNWTLSKRTKFANDKDNLVVVSNKSKKARNEKDLNDWQPKNGTARCNIAKRFVTVASKYALSIKGNDKTALSEQIASCSK